MQSNLIENRHIRLFISSTFQDMKDEREYLMTHSFPLLRKLALERNVTLTELDLRWGITEDEAKNGKVVDICLREVENSVPFFIGIIGNRYGWIPKKEDLWEGTIDRYAQVEEYLKKHLSVTEMEMQFGVLQRKEKLHAYFYIKDQQSDETDYPEMLKKLKEEVRKSDYPSSYYSSKENLAEQIEQAFQDLLDELFPIENTTELEKERIGQKAYLNQLCQSYIKDDNCFKILNDWLCDVNKRQLVITGASGLGKSALLANWLDEKLHDKKRDYKVIYHFTGNGGSQSSHHYVEQIIRDEIADQYHWGEEEIKSLSLEQLFNKIVAEKQNPLLIVIDAINQIVDEDDAKLLNWLPDANKSVKILYSTLEDDKTMESLKRRDYPIYTLKPLSKEQRCQLIVKHLGNFAKRLNENQIQRIADSTLCENTLVLRSLLDELISFGIYEKLDERIDSYLSQKTIEVFYQVYLKNIEEGLNSYEDYVQVDPTKSYSSDEVDKMLEDLQKPIQIPEDSPWEPFNINFLSPVVTLILLSKNGLTEDEIFSIIDNDNNVPEEYRIKRIDLSRILCSLSSHLITRNGLLSFSHTYISDAIWSNYIYDDENMIWSIRQDLLDYFRSEEMQYSERAYEEVAYQLYKLTELPFKPLYYNEWGNQAAIDLFFYISHPSIFFHLLKKSPYDLRKYWGAINYPLNYVPEITLKFLLISEIDDVEDDYIKHDQDSSLFFKDLNNYDEEKEYYDKIFQDILDCSSFFMNLMDDFDLSADFNIVLVALVEKTNNPNHKIKAYLESARCYLNYNLNLEGARKNINKLKETLSESEDDISKKYIIEAYKFLGDISSNLTDAERYYDKALLYARGEDGEENIEYAEIEEATALLLAKNDSYKDRSFIKAIILKDHFEPYRIIKHALEIKIKKLGENSLAVAETYENLGSIMGYHLDEGRECFKKALSIYRDLLGETHIKSINVNKILSQSYLKHDQYDKAVELSKMQLSILEQKDRLIYKKEIIWFQECLGHASFGLGNYKNALDYYRKSWESKNDPLIKVGLESKAQSAYYMGKTLLYLNKDEEGLKYIEDSFNYMKENSDNEKMKEHLGRLSLDFSVLTSFRKKESKGTNQLEEAFKHYNDIYIQMSDDK